MQSKAGFPLSLFFAFCFRALNCNYAEQFSPKIKEFASLLENRLTCLNYSTDYQALTATTNDLQKTHSKHTLLESKSLIY